jgi:hypothetical protein
MANPQNGNGMKFLTEIEYGLNSTMFLKPTENASRLACDALYYGFLLQAKL